MSTTYVAFQTTGCRTNQEEIEAIKSALVAAGCAVIENAKEANVIVVNTCSVTSLAETKTTRLIKKLAHDFPNAKLLITGCLAEQHGGDLLKERGVCWVVGNGGKHQIANIISKNFARGVYQINSFENTLLLNDDILSPQESGRTRFSIKIQEGCNFSCSYCIVPALRGKSRSAPQKNIIDTFKRALDKGYKEIVLTGTHIGNYRNEAGGTIENLLEEFLKTDGDYRVRLSSLDPRDLTDTLVSAVGSDARLCAHLHVSVQSFSADVLSRMNRPANNIDKLIERLRDFREKYPTAGLGADFIAGHPGESDAMFEETLNAVKTIGFSYAHVFRFSKRPQTPSAVMSGQVSESAKKNRSEELRKTVEQSRQKFLSTVSGCTLYIIVENEFPVRGVSANYLKVEIPNFYAPKNSWLQVRRASDGSWVPYY